MNPLLLIVLALAVLAAVGAVRLVVRGQGRSAAVNAAIEAHLAATGDYPTVADWRAGRVTTALEDPPGFDPDDGPEDGPVVVTVTVVDEAPRALPGGGGR
jgi:predicted membrane-bound mannosyltransferase